MFKSPKVTFYDYAYGTANNGNILSSSNQLNGARSQSYHYDALNRLDHAWSTMGTAWDINYTLDAWGNMTKREPSTSGFTNNPAPDYFANSVDSNNRLVSQMGYDAAGNVVADGNHNYVFDAENRVSSAAGVGYVYDSAG